jgi:hypothetical protein
MDVQMQRHTQQLPPHCDRQLTECLPTNLLCVIPNANHYYCAAFSDAVRDANGKRLRQELAGLAPEKLITMDEIGQIMMLKKHTVRFLNAYDPPH